MSEHHLEFQGLSESTLVKMPNYHRKSHVAAHISLLFSGISWIEYQALVTVATAISAFAFITLICVRRSASFGKYILVAICSPIVGKFAFKSLSADKHCKQFGSR